MTCRAEVILSFNAELILGFRAELVRHECNNCKPRPRHPSARCKEAAGVQAMGLPLFHQMQELLILPGHSILERAGQDMCLQKR